MPQAKSLERKARSRALKEVAADPYLSRWMCDEKPTVENIHRALSLMECTMDGHRQSAGYAARTINILLRIIDRAGIPLAQLPKRHRRIVLDTKRNLNHVKRCQAGSCEDEWNGIRGWPSVGGWI